jgi:P27 family predicted phage terminase small subunit
MKPGPRPQPTELRLLHGAHPGRLNTDTPVPSASEPVLPEWVDDTTREIWEHTVAELRIMGVLSSADSAALLVYSEAVAKFIEAAKLVDQLGGILVRGRRGEAPVKNPALQVMRDQGQLVRAYAAEFGLTPAAGLTVQPTPPPGGPERLLS